MCIGIVNHKKVEEIRERVTTTDTSIKIGFLLHCCVYYVCHLIK